ncbi:MAG: hypothetical protein KA313_01310 [Pseudarcicella sp.]|nr:hypothetical protein [Pseudarcicella sp.]MBP6409713.1 hypothetical protein [Pseudarcicella sp.]
MNNSYLLLAFAASTVFFGCEKTNLQVDDSSNSSRTSAVASINLNAGTLKQKVEIIGGDMERSAGFLNSASNADDIVKWCYVDTKFNACRVAINKKQELVEGTPTLSIYDKQIVSMQKIKAANANVKFWATLVTDYAGYGTENNLPDWIYSGAGYNGGSYDPTKLDAIKYARFICDYLKLMKTSGVPITYMSICKEWTSVLNATNEKKVIVEIIRLLGTTAYTGVVKPKFIGPATYGVGGGNTFLADVKAKAFQSYYDGFSTHQYDNIAYSNLSSFVSTSASMSKKAYQDETSPGANSATSGAEPNIDVLLDAYSKRADIYQAGMAGEMIFEQWSRGVNTETRSIYFKSGTAGTRMRGYYVNKDFTNNVLGLNYVGAGINSMSNVKVMTFKSASKIYLCIANTGTINYDSTQILIYGNTISTTTIPKKRWSATSSSTGDNSTDKRLTTNTFNTDIKAKTLTFYTISI